MKKQIIFLFILFCLFSRCSSQIITGQDPPARNPAQNQLSEKVYLHVDRSTYNPGDDIWFKAYVIDPSTNRLSLNTNNLQMELISADGEILQARTVRIEVGLGNGDFHLPDSVRGGDYRIRAYTNHMRNYGDETFFIKELNIVSAYDDEDEIAKPKQNTGNTIDISFFPEGGSLVYNITSTIAFKAVNDQGKGCDVTLEIYSSSGELVSKINSTHLGMGFFNLMPLPGFNFYTIAKSREGGSMKADLPNIFQTGVTIRTLVLSNKSMILTVSTNEMTLPLIKGNDLTLSLSSRNLINQVIKIKIDSLENNFLIPLDDFPEGILKVSLLVNENLPLCERLVYVHKNGDVALNIVTDKNVYDPREKVSTEVSLSGDSRFSGFGDFSFSAVSSDYADDPLLYPTSIASWFLLESDVRGVVEKPSYYFDASNKQRFEDLDLLLLTQGWRDFRWKYDSITSFNHEIGFSISGSVKRIVGKRTVEGAKINMGLFSSYGTQYLTTETNSEGAFTFKEIDFTGPAKVFISSTGKNNNIVGEISVDSIKYDPPEVEKSLANTFKDVSEQVNFNVLKQEASVKMNIKKKYTLNDTIDIGEVIVTAKRAETVQEVQVNNSRRTYGSPDKELVVSEPMENFSGDVFQMIAGRIPNVRVLRGVNVNDPNYPDDVTVIIRNQITKDGPLVKGALILLDGHLMDSPQDISNILSLPAIMIDRVDVLNASPAYGMSGANGVINIITRREMRHVLAEPRPNTASFKLKGFDAPRIFYSPKHDTSKDPSYTPDTRATVFWEPDIIIEKDKNVILEYYNADNPSTINITVEGITEEGIPVTGRTTYQVK